MKPGQSVAKWWQDYVAGRLRTPRDIFRAALQENPDNAQASERWMGIPLEPGPWQAPERLKAPQHILSEGSLRQWAKADWQQVDPRLMRWSAILIELARKRGVPLYVHCAIRTEAEQNKVNHSGNSKAAYPHSPHNIGEAVDIVHGTYHWLMTKAEWALIHKLGLQALDILNASLRKAEKLELTWGGDWDFYDPAHWQVSDYKKRTRRLTLGPPVRYTPRYILRNMRTPDLPPLTGLARSNFIKSLLR